ncbi:MAG: hypothetical protein ACOCSE_01400 [Chitinivibrionales bacterium]
MFLLRQFHIFSNALIFFAVCSIHAGRVDTTESFSDSSGSVNELKFHGDSLNTLPKKNVHDLDQMVVTATKSNRKREFVVEDVFVISGKEAEKSGALNAMEMFDAVPGMSINPARTQTNIMMNGIEGE